MAFCIDEDDMIRPGSPPDIDKSLFLEYIISVLLQSVANVKSDAILAKEYVVLLIKFKCSPSWKTRIMIIVCRFTTNLFQALGLAFFDSRMI
jgi:hypothetical protein